MALNTVAHVLQVLMIALAEIVPDLSQVRKTFPTDEIERLAASIKARGLIQPIRVRRDEQRNCWVIVLGECRWRAAKLAGLTHIPCQVVEGEPEEADLLADQVIENTVRNSLRPLELARALAKLKSLRKCTSQDLAKELGISGGAITKCEALLTLPETIQALVDDGRVSESAAYEIARVGDPEGQHELAQAVAAGRLTRDQVAEMVRGRIGKRNVTPKAGRLSCKLGGGISVTVSSGEPLTFDALLTALDHLRRQAKKLCDDGKEVSALSRVVRAS